MLLLLRSAATDYLVPRCALSPLAEIIAALAAFFVALTPFAKELRSWRNPRPIRRKRLSKPPDDAGSCVPNVWPADVDCLGGEGNGPYYTDGKQSFRVVGADRYGLDTNDQDTLACEPPARR